jgi:hypothetical protein
MKNIELARYFDESGNKCTVTVSDYSTFLADDDKEAIACFVFNRLYSRYIKPYKYESEKFTKEYKNGFSMMASYCLLIETLQSFKNGWTDSNGRSEQAFKEFFSNNAHFQELNGKGSKIYKEIRCGILHQGETANGWKITRDSRGRVDGKTLVDGKTINAVEFGNRLEKCLQDYRATLNRAEWDSELWDNLRTKMRKIIDHCA